jgi:FlaA1/EpsC-like NDP-sugar epimerase
MFKNKTILVTGGTGSLGKALVKEVLKQRPKVVRVLDIDETELFDFEHELEAEMPIIIKQDKVRFLVGDVKDKERVIKAVEHVDIIFHLAGLKHVESCEYNPFEAVKTNVLGTQNVIDAALVNNVSKVIFTSSDKAAYPNNMMGATKLMAERLITSANYYKGKRKTIFASVRFGNIIGSRGSVIPLWLKQLQDNQPLTVTDPEMTRFMMTKKQAISLIFRCAEMAKGGETFILKMPVIKIGDLADVLQDATCSNSKTKIIGMKAGETFYEELMTEEEASRAKATKEMFVVPPMMAGTNLMKKWSWEQKVKCDYHSHAAKPISKKQIRQMLVEEGIL